LGFLNEFWDDIIANKIVIKEKYLYWISKIPEILDPNNEIHIRNYYKGKAFWYTTSQHCFRYWSKNNLKKLFLNL
jgi:hypothetical protein